jgi:hypothetical protein
MPPDEGIEPRRIDEADAADVDHDRGRGLERVLQGFAQDASRGEIDIAFGGDDRSTISPGLGAGE